MQCIYAQARVRRLNARISDLTAIGEYDILSYYIIAVNNNINGIYFNYTGHNIIVQD